ncbi:MAG: sigma-70 family RNA polymerase sigma factor [Sandaracinaceae bacterium]|nr:sigma-70 family RNA polymerase sigma factor [Sandaracinaceae bacterium]
MESHDHDTTEEFQREVLARRGQLYGAALRMTGCPAQAEDLVQEAVMRAWTFWDRFQPGTNGRAWMHRILTNTFINGYRRKRREREILGEIRRDVVAAEGWDRGLHRVPGEGLSDEVTEALAGLAPDFRDVLVLVDLRGKSYREAADVIGCPIGTVMSRLHRARRAMKRELGAYATAQGYVTAQAA